jgi:RND family efflux transporter MFP subunit
MKKIPLFLFVALLLSACGGEKEKTVEDVIESGNLVEIRAKKSELDQRQQEIKAKIEQLNAEIEKLDKDENRTLVTAEMVNDTVFKHYIEVQGSVGTDQNIVVYPEYAGVLNKIYVNEGEKVSKGQILAKIDDGGLASQLAQLETKLALAKTTFERRKNLWEQNIGSEIQFLEAKSNYEAMQSSVDQMRSQLAKTVVRAPFSGVIDQVISNEGQVVTPGQNQLFRLINLNEMYVEADVPENYLPSVKEGMQALVEISSIGKEFEGKVKEVSSFVNPNNRSFMVRVAVPNNEGLVKPNLIASIKLNNYTAKNAIAVPQSAVKENAEGDEVVFVVEEKNDSLSVAKRLMVETGKSYDGQVEITKGLKSGQKIIIDGARSIRDGENVEVVEN